MIAGRQRAPGAGPSRPAGLPCCRSTVRALNSAATTAISFDEVEAAVQRQLQFAAGLELRPHIVEHIPMSDDLIDDDFAALGAASFRALDEEEDRRASRIKLA